MSYARSWSRSVIYSIISIPISFLLINPGVQGELYLIRKGLPTVFTLLTFKTEINLFFWLSTAFFLAQPLNLKTAIFLSDISFITILSSRGLGVFSIVYYEGRIKDIESSSLITGVVISIFSGVITGAVIEILLPPELFPKYNWIKFWKGNSANPLIQLQRLVWNICVFQYRRFYQ